MRHDSDKRTNFPKLYIPDAIRFLGLLIGLPIASNTQKTANRCPHTEIDVQDQSTRPIGKVLSSRNTKNDWQFLCFFEISRNLAAIYFKVLSCCHVIPPIRKNSDTINQWNPRKFSAYIIDLIFPAEKAIMSQDESANNPPLFFFT